MTLRNSIFAALSLVLGLALVQPAHAARFAGMQNLVKMTNDRASDYNDLALVMDDSGIVRGVNFSSHGSSHDMSKSFTLGELSSGAVLIEQQGIKALVLSGNVDQAAGTGRWTIRYVANGMSGTYKECQMNLQKSAQGWGLVNAYTRAPIRTAKIITWSMGITTIQGICPN